MTSTIIDRTCFGGMEVPDKPEVVLGVHETARIPVENLIMLSQVRHGKNPESEKLRESIESNGMINPIDVAHLSYEDLTVYIEFVNNVWGSSLHPSDYQGREINGYFYLVVAGHSRTVVVKEIAVSNPDLRYIINCKVHPISSPEDIINLQLEENIHSKPPVERQAMAIIESYMWGLRKGRWNSKQEFIRSQHGAVGFKQLSDALGFASLPSEMRQFVFGKIVPYTAALEIGRSMDQIIAYEKFMLGYDEICGTDLEGSLGADAMLDEMLKHRISELIMHISKNKLNSTASKRYIQGRVAMFRKELESSVVESEEELIGFEWAPRAAQAGLYARERRDDYQRAIAQLSGLPPFQIAELIRLTSALVGVNATPALDALNEAVITAQRMFGSSVLAGISAQYLSSRTED